MIVRSCVFVKWIVVVTTVGALWASTAAAQAPARPGVLLLAHGGKSEWNERVLEVARRVNDTHPTEVAFGMATRANIQAAIDKLAARGVTRDHRGAVVRVVAQLRNHVDGVPVGPAQGCAERSRGLCQDEPRFAWRISSRSRRPYRSRAGAGPRVAGDRDTADTDDRGV